MQVRDALKLSVEKFKESPTPSLDARLLLAHAMACTQEDLLINYDQELKKNAEKFTKHRSRFVGPGAISGPRARRNEPTARNRY